MEKDPEKRPADGAVLFRRLDAIRRKGGPPGRHADDCPTTVLTSTADATDEDDEGRSGPATLMSRLMRRELERQNRGGPVRRLFNRPWVLTGSLALVLGLSSGPSGR